MINFADMRPYLADQQDHLIQLLETAECTPSAVEVVDLPKDRINVRPLARLDMESRLVYEAAVFALAPHIQPLVPSNVYSYRWWTRAGRLLAPTSSWINLQQHGRRYHLQHPTLALARTDVTAFYENVHIETLTDEVSTITGPPWAREAVGVFLESFNNLSNVWGLPQGYDASGVLANLYLLPVDHNVRREAFFHLRYSDDMYVFGKDWEELRDLLVLVIRTLRNRHLTTSSSKTDIVEAPNVIAEFENVEKDAISYGVRNYIAGAEQDLKDMFDRATEPNPAIVRDLKFCLTQLRSINDPYAVPWLLRNLHLIPHAIREALVYLADIDGEPAKIAGTVASTLASRALISYPYAEQHLLIYLIRSGYFAGDAVDAASSILLNKNSESFLREMAARYLGLQLKVGQAALLKQELQNDPHPHVRRALLVAAYEAQQLNSKVLTNFSASDGPQRYTARYLLSSPSQIPKPRTERPPWTS